MKAFDYATAGNESGAMSALQDKYRIKAGGIDLLDMLKERIEPGDKFVGIHQLDLAKIEKRGDALAIGALATLRQLSENATAKQFFLALTESAGEAATPQIRARATVGGNICQRPRCWYFRNKDYECLKKGGEACFAVEGDNTYHAIFGGEKCHIIHPSNLAPALVAAGATIEIQSPSKKRSVPAGEFFVSPKVHISRENQLQADELIREILIPAAPIKSAYVEFRHRQSFDWPLAGCVVFYTGKEWRVVLSHVAPTPWRSAKAEEVLGGAADVTPELAERAAEAAVSEATPMSMNAFRVKLARAAVRRALLKACGKETT